MLNVGIVVSVPKCPAWLMEMARRLSVRGDIAVRVMPADMNTDVRERILLRWLRWLQQRIVPGNPEWWQPVDAAVDQRAGVDVLLNPLRLELNDDDQPAAGICRVRIDDADDDVAETVLSAWMLGRSSVCISIVQHSRSKGGNVLIQAETRLDLLSYPRSLTLVYSRIIDLMEDAVGLMAADAIDDSFQRAPTQSPKRIVSVLAVSTFGWRMLKRVFRNIWFDERWMLLKISLVKSDFSLADISAILSRPTGRQLIEPPSGYFWADPFLVEHNNQQFLFFEEADVRTGKGHLACLKHGDVPENRRIILKEPWHLSYPNVFQRSGCWYMIPESAANESVDLYKAVEFPWHWEKSKTLLSGIRAYDATIYEHNGRCWLFCTVARSAGSPPNDDLFLFYSDDLQSGNWIPHPANPVVRGAGRARPAGRIFRCGDNLIRPSQLSIPRYGYGIVFNRIVEWTETHYREESAEKIEPDRLGEDCMATHTWNVSGTTLVMDMIRRRPRLRF